MSEARQGATVRGRDFATSVATRVSCAVQQDKHQRELLLEPAREQLAPAAGAKASTGCARGRCKIPIALCCEAVIVSATASD